MGRTKTILVVDDEPAVLHEVKALFEGYEYEVLTETDSRAGLQTALTHQPDLILLDVTTPGLDGFEVLRRLKYQPATRQIPVIMLSPTNDTHSVLLSQDLQASDFIIKPFERQELLRLVVRCLALKTLGRSSARAGLKPDGG